MVVHMHISTYISISGPTGPTGPFASAGHGDATASGVSQLPCMGRRIPWNWGYCTMMVMMVLFSESGFLELLKIGTMMVLFSDK